jgi:hypothetical protein
MFSLKKPYTLAGFEHGTRDYQAVAMTTMTTSYAAISILYQLELGFVN